MILTGIQIQFYTMAVFLAFPSFPLPLLSSSLNSPPDPPSSSSQSIQIIDSGIPSRVVLLTVVICADDCHQHTVALPRVHIWPLPFAAVSAVFFLHYFSQAGVVDFGRESIWASRHLPLSKREQRGPFNLDVCVQSLCLTTVFPLPLPLSLPAPLIASPQFT